MLLSRKAVSCDLDSAPTFCASTLPFLNSISVGMPRMPYFFGTSWLSSTLTLATFELAGVFPGDFLEHRGDRLAGAAPFRPVIDQHRQIRFQHFGVERIIGDMMNQIAHWFLIETGVYAADAAYWLIGVVVCFFKTMLAEFAGHGKRVSVSAKGLFLQGKALNSGIAVIKSRFQNRGFPGNISSHAGFTPK